MYESHGEVPSVKDRGTVFLRLFQRRPRYIRHTTQRWAPWPLAGERPRGPGGGARTRGKLGGSKNQGSHPVVFFVRCQLYHAPTLSVISSTNANALLCFAHTVVSPSVDAQAFAEQRPRRSYLNVVNVLAVPPAM